MKAAKRKRVKRRWRRWKKGPHTRDCLSHYPKEFPHIAVEADADFALDIVDFLFSLRFVFEPDFLAILGAVRIPPPNPCSRGHLSRGGR